MAFIIDFGVELNAPDPFINMIGLMRECRAGRDQFRALGKSEPFAVPVIDHHFLREKMLTGRGWLHRVIADFSHAFGMGLDLCTKIARHHLRAQANAQIHRITGNHGRQPVHDGTDIIKMIVIGTHRSAKHDDQMIFAKIGRQFVAFTRTANIKLKPVTTHDSSHPSRLSGGRVENQ